MTGPLALPWRLLLVCLAGGCATVDLDEKVPPGFNLGGTWLLDPEASEVAPPTRSLRARGIGIAMVAKDFPVLRARRMDIEQNTDSMGIAYDSGDYRDVSWGKRERGLWEINAGWDAGVLRILSKARDAKAKETMTLTEQGLRLVVRIEIEADGDDLLITRSFTRAR